MKLHSSMTEPHISVAFMEPYELLQHMKRMVDLHKSNYGAPLIELKKSINQIRSSMNQQGIYINQFCIS